MLKFIGVTCEFHPVAVGIQETDGTISRDHQSLGSTDNRNPAPFQDATQLVNFLVALAVDTEVMELRHTAAAFVPRSFRQRLERHVVMLPAEAQKRHLRFQVSRRNLQSKNRAIEV